MALAHAILSSLIKRPRSGYDLAKDFDRVTGHFWKATHQQIYRELARMEQDGWVRVKLIKQKDRPDRKSYTATAKGKEELSAWAAAPVAVSAIREDLMVKLQAGALVERSVLVEEIDRHRQAHLKTQQFYEAVAARDFPDPAALPVEASMDYLVLRCGLLYEQAYVTWCDEALAVLGMDVDREEARKG